MPDPLPVVPVAPLPDPSVNPIGADIAKIFNEVVVAVSGTVAGRPFDVLEWIHIVSDVLWLSGDLVSKYGMTAAGFDALVKEFEAFAQVHIIDVMFHANGRIAQTISWVEKHLAGPHVLAVIRDALSKHKAAIVSVVPVKPAPLTPGLP